MAGCKRRLLLYRLYSCVILPVTAQLVGQEIEFAPRGAPPTTAASAFDFGQRDNAFSTALPTSESDVARGLTEFTEAVTTELSTESETQTQGRRTTRLQEFDFDLDMHRQK